MMNSPAALLFLMAFLLQTSAFQILTIKGVGPNILLCITIFAVLRSREPFGEILISMVFFLIYDIYVSQYIGSSAAAGLCIGIFVYFISRYVNFESIISIIILVSMSTLLYNFIIWTFAYTKGSCYTFSYVLRLTPFYLLYNAVISVLLYLMLMKNLKDRC